MKTSTSHNPTGSDRSREPIVPTLQTVSRPGRCTAVLLAFLLTLLASGSASVTLAAPIGTAFTYQGDLEAEGAPAEGNYDFRFSLHDSPADGLQLGPTLTNTAVVVTAGRFAVSLDFENQFTEGRWLEIGVRTNGSTLEFMTLAPRQNLTPAPYSIVASALAGALPSPSLTGVYAQPVTMSNPSNQFDGTFTGDGAKLIALNAGNITQGTLSDQRLSGNVALLDASQMFSGVNTFGDRLDVQGTVSASSFVGSGQDLTGLNADQLATGSVPGARLSNDVALLTRNNQTFTGDNRFQGVLTTGTDTSDNVVIANAPGAADRGAIQIKNETGTDTVTALAGPNGGQLDLTDNAGGRKASLASAVEGPGVLTLLGNDGGANIVASHLASNRPNYGSLSVHGKGGEQSVKVFADEDGAGKVRTFGDNGALNVSLGLGADTDHGALATYDEAATATTSLRSTLNGGQADLRDSAGENRVSAFVGSDNIGKVFTYGSNGELITALGSGSGADRGGVYAFGPGETSYGLLYADNNGGRAEVRDPAGVTKAQMFVASDGQGWMVTDVIRIKGGSDIAEPFNVSHPEDNPASDIEPGMVVAIDPLRPGELRLSTQAYDRTVAGIISGAGGVQPGLMLQQEGTLASGKHPVALTGRVWCHVDADEAPVQPGDLLTTSDTPGHAMKVTDHTRALGAILGKAMTPLPSGQGLVLVLVSLQ